MAAIVLKAGPKVPVSFEDVPVYFIKTGWKLLDLSQRILHKRVSLENYRHFVSLGLLASKPHLVSWLEQGDEPQAADFHGTRAAAGLWTGDRIENRTLTSKQKHCPQELPRTDPRAGNESQVARPTGETANRTGKHARSPQTGSGRDDQPGERGQGGSSGEGRAMRQRRQDGVRRD
ncbi:zinc finger protein 92 homolog [Lynx rufus]|uniref:zinc finger protein 92 homolog n=1 Tax=Lynx rufus TaxID=61384 RepID=UPI001F1268D5|nr:zinc finger protein 92 homolog [Lynx rufus]XP_046954460.1 zinc finger protein 92 homolog [Lynx rufus]